MKNFFRSALTAVVCILVLANCSTHKKPKCRTCPKWEDQIILTSEMTSHEEEYRPGIRP